MPEFGVLFKIDADYDTVEWYGNGPAETYWDRQHGAKLGIYQNKVADNMAQYLVPQECGAKTAVRWAKVVDRKGRGLLFTADAAKPMFFSALPYTPHEMESAKHPYELPPVHYTVIRAIGEQMCVGGDDSWGANVHPEYIPDVTKPVEFTFTFRGICPSLLRHHRVDIRTSLHEIPIKSEGVFFGITKSQFLTPLFISSASLYISSVAMSK